MSNYISVAVIYIRKNVNKFMRRRIFTYVLPVAEHKFGNRQCELGCGRRILRRNGYVRNIARSYPTFQ